MKKFSDNTNGALLMVLSMAGYTLNDICMKIIMLQVPFFQAILMRGIGTVIILILIARWMGGLNFRMTRFDGFLVSLRALSEIGATYFFLSALVHMPIANVTAILQVLPLTVTLAAAVLFGDRLGWRRLLAIMIGFVGVMIIVRPGVDGFNVYAINALIAVAFITVRDLCSRRISPQVSSITVAFISAVGITGFAYIGMWGNDWVSVSTGSVALLFAAIFFILCGYLASVMTMRVGEISFIAPFRYTGLLWALLAGLVFFSEWPDRWTMFGIVIVVVTGVFSFYRERKLARWGHVTGEVGGNR